MISQGTIPSTLSQIFAEHNGEKFINGRNYESRRHGNLTTFAGLVMFRRLVANRVAIIKAEKERVAKEKSIKIEDVQIDEVALIKPYLENDEYKSFMNMPSKHELDTDVIKYDYQILDDAYWLLSENGFKIIRK